MRQTSFLPKINLAYGGAAQKGKRKTARPFDPKRPIHIVLKSARAKNEWSLLRPRNKDLVEKLLRKNSLKYKIKIYRSANVGNHIHLLLTTQTKSRPIARQQLADFLRQLAGELAQKITQASKSNPVGRFWETAYTRIVSWGREFENIKRYLIKNLFEAAGIWNRKKNPEWELISLRSDPEPG